MIEVKLCFMDCNIPNLIASLPGIPRNGEQIRFKHDYIQYDNETPVSDQCFDVVWVEWFLNDSSVFEVHIGLYQ